MLHSFKFHRCPFTVSLPGWKNSCPLLSRDLHSKIITFMEHTVNVMKELKERERETQGYEERENSCCVDKEQNKEQ